MRVIIMQGVSGSGKSTYAKEKFPEATVCSADSYFTSDDGTYDFMPEYIGHAHKACLRQFVDALGNRRETIVVDNTNTSQVEMAPYVAMAALRGYKVEIIRCEAPLEVCIERNTHGVPAGACTAMADRMEDPVPFWDVTFTEVHTGPPMGKRDVLMRLLETWERMPDLRLGQLVSLAVKPDKAKDIFYIKNTALIEELETVADRNGS